MNVRPIMVNDVDDIATRPDLADWCVLVTLLPIPSSRRRRERYMTSAFDKAVSFIHGPIPTALSSVLAQEPMVRLLEVPRMADFAVFATAAEFALAWRPFKQGLDGEGIHRGGTR
jgi:hypothetical protein